MIKHRHHERGQSIAEFALTTTAAMVFFFGILDFGRALYTYDLVGHDARLGSRYAIVHGSSCTTAGCPATSATIQTYVRGLSPGLTTANLAVVTSWPGGNDGCSSATTPYTGPGCVVSVSVSYPFAFVAFPFAAVTMTSVSQETISQ